MSKSIVIQENGVDKPLSVDVLRLKKAGGGSVTRGPDVT